VVAEQALVLVDGLRADGRVGPLRLRPQFLDPLPGGEPDPAVGLQLGRAGGRLELLGDGVLQGQPGGRLRLPGPGDLGLGAAEQLQPRRASQPPDFVPR
jgi:hypothetical protein